MAADWVRFCRTKDPVVNEPYVELKFRDERRHRVIVTDEGDAYLISGFIVRQSVVTSIPDLPVQVWMRNRVTKLVGFRIDRRLLLVGEAWVPKAGLRAEEFQMYLRTLAAECDRFEYILTGKAVE